ncbi:MAG TPA: aminopeptidase P N-terminal domain-containing protein [Myxococcales bacterium]|nr:aminopeptidase P N-terminal domain-containing protein [Myxococcales bacterium]
MATTPSFPPEVFQARRAEVLRRMRELSPGPSVAVFPATPVATRNNDVEYPYRADSDLFWLTGFEEPEAVAVLSTEGKPLTLFVRPRDREREIWNGRRAGVEGAKASFGADQAFTIDELEKQLPQLLGSAHTLYYRLGAVDPAFDARIARMVQTLRMRSRAGTSAPQRIEDPGQIVHELRLHKSPEELRALRKAVELTRKAHLAAMAAGRPGSHEYELQALLEREFRGGGGRGWGYYPIVAAGANATVLHYNDNADAVREGDLILIDAGAEADLYTADVTRTFPATGRFNPAQRGAYSLVLSAADHAIAAARPGATLDALHDGAVRILTEGMVKLGLLSGDVDQLIKDSAFRRYYMHRTSHWLGLDVHDAGSYRGTDGGPRKLEPGMVFTVEPGLYVAPDDEKAPAELRGLGIRIEDDILITEAGHENLTAAIPRTVEAVEAATKR